MLMFRVFADLIRDPVILTVSAAILLVWFRM